MIGSLAARVRELSLRVADLEGQLDAARRRIAVYEDFDAQVGDSLTTALKAANQIRARAQVSAEALLAEARAARPEIAVELDAMRAERDALRRVIDSATPAAPRPQAAAPQQVVFPMSEMRTAATEALRGVFKELVAEIRATAPVAPAAVQTQAVAPSSPANSPSSFAPSATLEVPAVQRPAPTTPPPASNVTISAPQAQPYQAPQPEPAPVPVYSPPPPVYSPPPPAALVEDEDVMEVPPPPRAPAPQPAPEQLAPEQLAPQQLSPQAAPVEEKEEWVQANDPVGEVQVVLSPISSFPRLVELERRLQGMPVVRTVYARDFRNGVATLAIGLRHPMTVTEFADAVTKLEYPRLRILSTSGYVLELRIDTEASSIA